jgi:D-alanyl-D-alanine carboxypeptidase/cell division protein FtsN
MAVALLPAAVHAQPYVTARGAIIVDADSGAVIWESNADEPLPPASTTKVMTAILALQSHQLDEHFAVSTNAAATAPSKIGLRPGQTVALRDLLYAVLLKSANDAAVVVAEGVAGSEYAFADRMNLKARVIGASQTNFVNPHGLTEYGHVTTARDLSRIFRYGLGVPGFREVLSTPAAEVPVDGPDGERLTLVRSHNRLLDFQVIGKTGYTRPARRCFVGAAGQGSREVVIAILGSNDLWGDARRMLDYGLSPSRPMPVLMASGSPPPPPVPVLEAAPAPVAVARAEPMRPAAELRAAPPPPEPARPVAVARAEPSLAPEPALARAARMARARQDVAQADPDPARLGDDQPAADEPSGEDDRQPARRPEPVARPPEPVRAAAPPPEPARGAAPEPEPARDDAPSKERAAPQPRRETIVPADRERGTVEPAGMPGAPDEPAQPSQSAAPAAERESPHGGVWADPPVRDPADEKPAARPDSRGEADDEPAPRTARSRAAARRTSKDVVADQRDVKRGETGRAAKADDDEEPPHRGRMTAEERRRAAAEARADAAESRRHASSRELHEERRRGVTLIRASASDDRPSRRKSRVVDDEPTKPTSRSRTGRHSPEGDTDEVGRKAARTTGRTPGRDVEKDAAKFTVQLGPYRTRKAVDSARADLSRLGYEARVVGQSLQLGNFAERSRADKLANRLRVTGHPATSTALR